MTWCSKRRGGTAAAEQLAAENTSNGSADLVRADCFFKPPKKCKALCEGSDSEMVKPPARMLSKTRPRFSAVSPGTIS